MISLLVFTILAAGIFYSTLQARRMAEANVREAIAVAVASGFLEQMAATDFPLLAQHLDDRTRIFPFVSRDGQFITPGKTLQLPNTTAWGEPIRVPIVDRINDAGERVDGPEMDFWFIPAVGFSTDTPNDAIEIRLQFRWDNGRSIATGFFPERTLVAIRTRIPN
ncbi:MAG: hypothetical protein JJT96_19410 [Opitutales bacterium]|nr:hypothetical protein [Opitutales bacterium]